MVKYTFSMRFYKEYIDNNNDYKLMLNNIYFIKDKKNTSLVFTTHLTFSKIETI